MRKILLGGVLGGLPGMTLALLPLLLADAGVITSDQSQIGYTGIPLLFIGVVVGMLVGASETGHGGAVALGVAIGFAVGLSAGLAIAVLGGIPVIWLFLAPATMIAGGILGAWWAEHHERSHPYEHRHV